MTQSYLTGEFKNIPVHEVVNAIFAGTKSLVQAAIPIRNVIQALGDNRTDLENALAGTYYRMCLLMESLTRLDKRQDFQVALQCARCLYELNLDTVELVKNPTLVPKFFAYTFVARFAAANKLVEELTTQGIVDPEINKHERQFIGDAGRKARFDTERAKFWPGKNGKPTTPINWTGQKLPERVTNISTAELLRYHRVYSFLCWYTHAGIVGVADISAEGLERSMGLAHCHSQEFFSEATNLVARQFDIYKANPNLRIPVDDYKHASEKVMSSYMRRLETAVERS